MAKRSEHWSGVLVWHAALCLIALVGVTAYVVRQAGSVSVVPPESHRVVGLAVSVVRHLGIQLAVIPMLAAALFRYRNGLVTVTVSVIAMAVPILFDAWGVVNLALYAISGLPGQLTLVGVAALLRHRSRGR